MKTRRQMIFVTHNPNIPVLGDAERVFVLDSCGDQARKAAEGTVDECKKDIVTLLEGGEDAFNHAVRTERWRYIRYANGDEELYDHDNDPHEWNNLANDPHFDNVKRQLAEHVPKTNAPYAPRLPRQKFTQEFDWSKP